MTDRDDKPNDPPPVLHYRPAPIDWDDRPQGHWSGKAVAIVLALPIIVYFGFGVVYRIWLLFQ